MAGMEYHDLLQQGTTAWNAWRLEHPEIIPDLSQQTLDPETLPELLDSASGRAILRGLDLSQCRLSLARMQDLDLSGADLTGTNLRRARLRRVDLSGARLVSATLANAMLDQVDLTEADLTEAVLYEAVLERTDLGRARLERANLVHARLERAKMPGADLRRATGTRAVLPGADLAQADLAGADLREACLTKAGLLSANLAGADLEAADLDGAQLLGAHLERATLRGARLNGTDLRRAHLQESNLRAADLRHADLRNADLRDANVALVRYNRWARYQGARLSGAYGAPQFLRFAQDQEYIEESRGERHNLRWWLIYLPWLISSDCGRSLGLWALWSLLLAVLFGIKFWDLGPAHFAMSYLDHSLPTMVYYSIVTFTTLGFGDVVPKTAEAARWVVAEVVVGYVMLGGLIAIFSNKLARRS